MTRRPAVGRAELGRNTTSPGNEPPRDDAAPGVRGQASGHAEVSARSRRGPGRRGSRSPVSDLSQRRTGDGFAVDLGLERDAPKNAISAVRQRLELRPDERHLRARGVRRIADQRVAFARAHRDPSRLPAARRRSPIPGAGRPARSCRRPATATRKSGRAEAARSRRGSDRSRSGRRRSNSSRPIGLEPDAVARQEKSAGGFALRVEETNGRAADEPPAARSLFRIDPRVVSADADAARRHAGAGRRETRCVELRRKTRQVRKARSESEKRDPVLGPPRAAGARLLAGESRRLGRARRVRTDRARA